MNVAYFMKEMIACNLIHTSTQECRKIYVRRDRYHTNNDNNNDNNDGINGMYAVTEIHSWVVCGQCESEAE